MCAPGKRRPLPVPRALLSPLHTPPRLGLRVRPVASPCRGAATSEPHGPAAYDGGGSPRALSQREVDGGLTPRQQGGVSEVRPQRACGRLTEDSGSPHGQLCQDGVRPGRSYLLPALSGQWPRKPASPAAVSLPVPGLSLPPPPGRLLQPHSARPPRQPPLWRLPVSPRHGVSVPARATQPTTRSTGHGARVRPDPPPADSVSPGWSLPQPPRHSAPLPRGLWEDRRAPGTSWDSEPTVTCRPVSHPQAPGPRCGPAAGRRPGFALGSSWGPPSASVPGAGFSVKNCFSFLFRSGRPRGGGTL